MILSFSATPEKIILKSIELADIKANSIVYDVGAGDGRISLECAKLNPTIQITAIDNSSLCCRWIEHNKLVEKISNVHVLHQDAESISFENSTHIFYTLKNQRDLEERIAKEISSGTKVITFGTDFLGDLKLKLRENVSIQGEIYDLSISIRNFESVTKLYSLTVQQLIEDLPSRLQYFWAGPFTYTIFVYEKE